MPPGTPNIDFDDLEFEFTLRNHTDKSLASCVVEFSGQVKFWDEDLYEDRVIGNISGYRINLKRARNSGMDQDEMLEQISAEVADFAETILTKRTMLDAMFDNLMDESDRKCNYLIYVAEISIEPEFRCMGLGSTLLSKIPVMMDVSHSMIALKAFPINHEYGTPSDLAEIARVKHFYEKQKFVHVGGDYMARLYDSSQVLGQ